MKRFIALWVILTIGLFACDEVTEETSVEQAEDTQALPYTVLRMRDFITLTGCDVSMNYESAVQTAFDYLVFFEGEDRETLDHVQREIIPLFESLIQSGTSNLADTACLPDSLRRIGEELGLLVSINKTEFDVSGTDGFETGANPVRFDPDAENFPVEEGLTYALQSRSQYINSTECLLSPASYGTYQAAFIAFFFEDSYPEEAPVEMAAFLSDVRDSRPLLDGSLNPQCLTPGLLKLGKDIGVLSESGKLISQSE